MLAGLRQFLCRLRKRSYAIAFALFVAWFGWWVWEPVPEQRRVFPSSGDIRRGQVSIDGFFVNVHGISWTGEVQSFAVYELQSGKQTVTLSSDEVRMIRLAPDGLACVSVDHLERKYLRSLPGGHVVCVLPPSKSAENDRYLCVDWAPFGKYVLQWDDDVAAYDRITGKCVNRFPVTQYGLRADGLGLVGLAEDKIHLVNYRFDTRLATNSIAIPEPSASEPRMSSTPEIVEPVSVAQVATNRDGTVIVIWVYRGDDQKDRQNVSLAKWTQASALWSETPVGSVKKHFLYDIEMCLRVSDNGRLAATRSEYPAPLSTSSGGFNSAESLWDISSAKAKCLNRHGIPIGYSDFDPSNTRVVVRPLRQNPGYSLCDTKTLELLASGNKAISPPAFSIDGNWLAFTQYHQSAKSSWLGKWLPALIEKTLFHESHSVRLIRLTDGKTIRDLPCKTSPQFTKDGSLWTVTEESEEGNQSLLVIERWSPEPPGPPWWLWALSAMGVVVVVRDAATAATTKVTR